MIQDAIARLVQYGLATELIEKDDAIWAANHLLEILCIDVLDEKTELVHPEQLDGWETGLNAVQWIDHLCAREGGTGASGVYDADVTGNHIDRVYGLYWWD